jgi:hypothetical protein
VSTTSAADGSYALTLAQKLDALPDILQAGPGHAQ